MTNETNAIPVTRTIEEFEIPKEFPKATKGGGFMDYSIMEARYAAIDVGMFAHVNLDWVVPLAKWIGRRKCLEVMAGRGILSLALRQQGVDVITTDDFSWGDNKKDFTKWQNPVTEMEQMDAVAAVEKYGAEINLLIMSWPYMDDTAYRVIKRLHEVNKFAKIIYIGEGHGGCTANDEFFNHFQEIEDDEVFNKAVDNYRRFPGIHDYINLGTYSEKANY